MYVQLCGSRERGTIACGYVPLKHAHTHTHSDTSFMKFIKGAKRGSLISPPAGMLSKQGPGTVASTNRPGHNGQVGHNADTGLLSSKRTTEKATELPPRKKGRASSRSWIHFFAFQSYVLGMLSLVCLFVCGATASGPCISCLRECRQMYRKSLAQAGSPKGRNLSGTQNVVKKINNAPTTISPSPRLLTTTSTGGKGGTPGGVAKKKPQFTKQPPQKKQSTPGKKQQKKHDVQADEPPVVVAHPEQSPRAWAGSRGAKTAFSQQQRHRHQLLLFQQQQQQLLLQHRAATPSAPGDLRVGDLLPNFQVRTSVGKGQVETVTIHDYFGSQWGVLMTIAPQAVQECLPTCRQDVAMMTKLLPRFTQLNIKVAGTSVEEPEKQQQWLPSSDGAFRAKHFRCGQPRGGVFVDELRFPLQFDVNLSWFVFRRLLVGRRRDNFGFFADPDGALSQAIGASLQPPHHQLPAWMVFSHKVLVISPGKQIRFVSSNVPVVARNFAEILRIVSCLQQFEIL